MLNQTEFYKQSETREKGKHQLHYDETEQWRKPYVADWSVVYLGGYRHLVIHTIIVMQVSHVNPFYDDTWILVTIHLTLLTNYYLTKIIIISFPIRPH